MPSVDRLYLANGADGTLRIFDGTSYASLKVVPLGDDADNIRYDAGEDLVYVGYESEALGILRSDGAKERNIKLDSHPESFQLEKSAPRVFVNLPKSRKIVVIDRNVGTMTSNWQTAGLLSNYPMALDEADKRLFVVFRQPPQLTVFDTATGKIVAKLPAVGDSDVFFDQERKRIYASGGDGRLSVYQQDDADNYRHIFTVTTITGARTAFFSPDLDRFFLAVRQEEAVPAAIRVYKPD